jgi:hypothetical protein
LTGSFSVGSYTSRDKERLRLRVRPGWWDCMGHSAISFPFPILELFQALKSKRKTNSPKGSHWDQE